MRKLITGIIALCILNVGVLSAHIRTVSNNAVNAGQYTNLQTAVNAANAGDTIYVMGSPTDYGAVTITKPRITLMGAGYNITGLQYNYITEVDNISLNGGVNSVKIQGLYVNGNIQQGSAGVVDSVDIERCYVTNYVYVLGPYCIIRNNDIDNINVNNFANIQIQNNFLQDVGNMSAATDTIDHNNFVTYSGNVTSYSGATSLATFKNNVFYYCNPENTTNCVFKNNMCSSGSAYNLNTYASNTGTGNIFATPPGWTDATIPASTVSQNAIWNYNWTFTAASSAHLAATDGTDIGVYGGKYPMPNLNGYTHIPQMVSMSTNGIAPFGGNVSLSFKGQGNMAHGTVSGEYFFDNDPGFGNGTSISFASGDSVTVTNQSIPVGSLTSAIHVIGVRVKDSSGHWSLYAAQNFYVQPPVTLSPPVQIVSAEYFFDKDPGQGYGTPLVTGSAADSVNVSQLISVASLSTGYHNVFIRTENALGQWSLYEGRSFYVQPSVVLQPVSQIVSAEYFFDKDPGQGYGTSIATGAPADSVNISTSESIASLTTGYHSVFIRTQNAAGQWSLYQGQNFFISAPITAPAAPAKIIAAEYFFDKDPGQGYGTSIAVTKGDSVNYTNVLSVGSLTSGFHSIFIRTQDTAGRWSLYQGQNFYVQPTVVITKPSKIVAAEYYFDFDPYNGVGNGSSIPGVIKADSVNDTQLLNASALSLGVHNILIRVKDSIGHWSLYEDRKFTVKACTIATTAKVINNVSCNGGNNGSAEALPSSGTPPYTYSWSTTVKQTNDTATGLSAGTYTIIVSDTSGCSAVDSVTIKQPTSILISINKITNTTCDSANGKAIVKASGGKGGIYTYSWNTTPLQTGNTATNLSAGTYVVTVLDSGCVATDSIKIAPSTLPSIIITTNPSKCGDSIGTAIATVSSGTPPYRYEWTNGDTLNFDSGLPAGIYQVTVHDKNGCTNTQSTIINNSNGPIISLVGQNNVLCSGQSNGLLSISVSAGAPPYTYAWSNGATTSTISSLPTGPYVITATDKTGCFSDTSFYVSSPLPLSLTTTTTNSGCSVATGSATVAVSGGTSPFTYAWNDG
ncbi:MAG TPA: SprB repeat-containing protein, partial [Bacteroidia bacterium]|nr:SprB repeat-containing protein [Bacteroidia bacterium]